MPALAPIVLLIRPQMGENIGAVARAMANFGLQELRLVAPRDGWPNPKALKMASGAEKIVETAKLYPDFLSATADMHLAYATTARPRDMEKRVVTPEEAMREILVHTGQNRDGAPSLNIALVFGPERTGLENEDLAWCDTLITIPTAPEKTSLNLAQSVVILGYEWFKQASERRDQDSAERVPHASRLPEAESLAAKAHWQGLFGQLESYLDEVNYYRVAEKKEVMWHNMRNMLLRGQWTEQEIRSLRGALRAIWERRRRNE